MHDDEAPLHVRLRSPLTRSRLSRLFALGLIAALLLPSFAVTGLGPSVPRAHGQGEPQAPELPPPPPPMTVPDGPPDAQAAAFADAMDQVPDNVAAWLGLYDALDIPVIGPDGSSLGVDNGDPIGPAYWEVWYASAGTADSGLSLADFGTLLARALEDDADYGTLLLDDIRSAAASDDPQIRLFGAFVVERMRRGSIDPLADGVTPDALTIDAPTMLLVGWSALRGAFIIAAQSGATSAVPAPKTDMRLKPALPPRGSESLQGLAATCELGSPGVSATWLSFALSQMRGDPRGFKSALQTTSDLLAGSIPITDAQMTSQVLKGEKIANVLPPTYLLALQMAGYRLQATASPATLVRTKEIGNWGEKVDLNLTLTYSRQNLPGGDARTQCLLYFAYKELGAEVNFPPDGPVSGAELITTIVTSTQRVGFPSEQSATRAVHSTDGGGTVVLNVSGRPQPEELPDTVSQVDLDYTIIVTLQFADLTTLNEQNMVTVGPTVVAQYPLNVQSPLLEALDGFKFRLKKQKFPLQDWEILAWKARMGTATSITGTVCDFSQPFAVEATDLGGLRWSMVYTPSDSERGTFVQTMTVGPSGVDIVGSYTLHKVGDDKMDVNQAVEQMCVESPDGRQCVPAAAGMDVAPIWFETDPAVTDCQQTQPQQ